MNRKIFPMLLMLAAGIISCIYTFILQYSTLKKLVSLFIVLLVFYLLGSIIVWVIDCFVAESENQLKEEEGEAIEEDTEGQEGVEGQEDAENQEGAERQRGDQEEAEEDGSEESGMN